MAEKSTRGQANRRQKHGLVWEIERKLAKLSKTPFTCRSSSFAVHNPWRNNDRRSQHMVVRQCSRSGAGGPVTIWTSWTRHYLYGSGSLPLFLKLLSWLN
jgi:hypothetical protein